MDANASVCPICQGPTRVHIRVAYDDRYGYPGTFTILACRHCGHRFVDANFSDAELASQYTDYYPRSERDIESFQPPVEHPRLRTWVSGLRASAFRWVPRNVRVLDVGCGFGETLAYHRARGCDAHGIDADANLLRVAARYGLNAKVGLFHPSLYEPESFDYVTLDQVVEHARSPFELLSGVATVLKPHGVAVIATPNAGGYGARLFGDKWINWHVPYHLQHFNERSLRILARAAGFEVVSMRTITNSAWLMYQWFHLFSRPPVGEASPFWAPRRSTRRIRNRIRRSASLAERLRVFDAGSRVTDALGLGDNIVAVLRRR